MAEELTPEIVKYLEMQKDHHQEMIDYHTDMLKMMKQIGPPTDVSKSQSDAATGPYARGSVSPLGGTAKPSMVFKAPKQ